MMAIWSFVIGIESNQISNVNNDTMAKDTWDIEEPQ